jgi:hypothetical protein
MVIINYGMRVTPVNTPDHYNETVPKMAEYITQAQFITNRREV